MVGDVAHVVVDGPGRIDELLLGDASQRVMKRSLHVLGRFGIMHPPYDHRHETDLAVTDPAQLVFEVPLRDDCSLAELARTAHCTCKMIVDL
jgi:hypothetical protein